MHYSVARECNTYVTLFRGKNVCTCLEAAVYVAAKIIGVWCCWNTYRTKLSWGIWSILLSFMMANQSWGRVAVTDNVVVKRLNNDLKQLSLSTPLAAVCLIDSHTNHTIINLTNFWQSLKHRNCPDIKKQYWRGKMLHCASSKNICHEMKIWLKNLSSLQRLKYWKVIGICDNVHYIREKQIQNWQPQS